MTYSPALQHRMRLGESAPPVRIQLRERESPGTIDLAGATVEFVVARLSGEAVVMAGAATVESPYHTLTLRYAWDAGDTVMLGAGIFVAHFVVTAITGVIRSYPEAPEFIELIVS